MNKKVMALAVAGALAAPAAALAQVQIGGGLTLLYFSHDPDNSSSAQTSDVMQSSESELRISGTEKLGGGLEVWFQCATSIDGIFNGNSVTTAGLCTRNSGLGFRGGMGNIFFGNWDTPTKLVQNRVRGWFSGTNPLVGGGYVLLGGGAASGGGNTGTSMYRRQANAVNYWSPNFGGFSFAAAFSAANEKVTTPESNNLSPRLYGLNGVYAAGPLWVGVAYEAHDDYNPASAVVGGLASQYNGGTDNNITFAVGYTFAGTFNIRATYSKSEYEPTNAGNLEVKGYGLYADWQIAGPHALRLAYVTADDVKGSSNSGVGVYRAPGSSTGGDVTTIAYSYDFSKRTQMFFAYNQMKSDTNASFSMGVAAASLGSKQSSLGAGLKHSF